ncbi:hypothetical protein KJI95_02030 [Shewanella sp. JM162201]|uniref:Uncharacterized protein n=1 Tax=Shewanella jiangmenensis TaxID=2837387 RepID=A0ABS5V2L7_9GAMM|nr:hypothetical protein [Shewanella jiangmenensis]MBT1443308.1 hypothetical protein [Shewanella jiangmenensis]
MTKDYRVIDSAKGRTESYLRLVCFRSPELKKEISLWKWFVLTIVEMVVGTELLESFLTTGSVSPYKTLIKEDSTEYGNELHLTLHIPAGLITNLLRNKIIELLYYKHFLHYLILVPVGEPCVNDESKTIDCSRTRFRARKNIFYQFISLRRVYDLFWLVFNITIDLLVFLATTDIQFALLSALTIEAIRRLLRL